MLKNMEKDRLLLMIEEIKHQVAMGHFLNAHFRAFEVANEAWKEHIRVNARIGAKVVNSPGGAVLDDERDERIRSIVEKDND